jgi:predicted metal-dependent peptidase
MRPVFDDTSEDKLSYARANVVFNAPYFASIVHGFIYVPADGLGTMGVTAKMVLLFDPQWVKEATIPNLAADIVHEINHFLRKHFERAGMIEDPDLFNLAGDLAINPDIRDAKCWELADESSKRPAVFPKHYGLPEGLSTEEYYAKLLQMKQNNTLKQQGKPKAGQKAPQGGGGGDQKPDKDGQGNDPSSGGDGQKPDGKEETPRSVCAGRCGSIAGGVDDPKFAEKMDAKEGRSEVEIASITKRTAADIKAHAEAHGRGSLPKNLHELANALIEEPHVSWQNELSHIIRNSSGRIQAGGEDFSMSRPSKRSIIRGIVRPGMIEHQPEVAIVRDTSGSMNIKQLNACIREAYHILQALGVDEAWFADADADVAMPWKRVGPSFFRSLSDVHGRGGTSFIPAIRAAEKLFPRPDLLVYCTDGDGSAPKRPPQYMEVVWCLIMGGHTRGRSPARWGHPVIISENPKDRKAAPILPEEDELEDDDEDELTV